MQPNQVEPLIRQIMGAVKRAYNHQNATQTSTGTANAQVITYSVSPAAYVAGDCYSFIIGAALQNTGPATLAVNSLAATTIQIGANALIGGELQPGQATTMCYDGTVFQIITPSISRPPTPNLLINGSMLLDQANEGASVAVAGTSAQVYGPDGWFVSTNTTAATGITIQGVAWAGTTAVPNSILFTRATKVTIGTGSATVNAGDWITVGQRLEAVKINATAEGTAGARAVSLSFCMDSNVASAVISVAFRSITAATGRRTYTIPVTLGAANTPVCPSFSIPGDTSGTWSISGSGVGADVAFALEAGSTGQFTANSWQTMAGGGQASAVSTQTQLSLTSGAFLRITGVKLEVSPVPTPFYLESPQQLISDAERYYEKSYDIGTALGAVASKGMSQTAFQAGANGLVVISVPFKVEKRCDPTMIGYSPVTGAAGNARDYVNAADVAVSFGSVGMMSFPWQATPCVGANVNLGLQWSADCRL